MIPDPSIAVCSGDRHRRREMLPLGIVFGLVMAGVWAPPGRIVLIITVGTLLGVIFLNLRSDYSARQLGLTLPLQGLPQILAAGAVLAGLLFVAGFFTRTIGPPQPAPWHRVWQYGIWAMLQEFLLQSFFLVRLEALMNSRRAVWAAALLFAAPHLPNLLLTSLSFLGGLFFCGMFRRYRNLYPLGVVHAALGLTLAASLPNNVLHHMRVGIGYLMYHP